MYLLCIDRRADLFTPHPIACEKSETETPRIMDDDGKYMEQAGRRAKRKSLLSSVLLSRPLRS